MKSEGNKSVEGVEMDEKNLLGQECENYLDCSYFRVGELHHACPGTGWLSGPLVQLTTGTISG